VTSPSRCMVRLSAAWLAVVFVTTLGCAKDHRVQDSDGGMDAQSDARSQDATNGDADRDGSGDADLDARSDGQAGPPSVGQWRVYELTFESDEAYQNPFMDVTFSATFVHDQGDTITRLGFWDGGRHFKIRFAPTKVGRWTYQTHSDPTDSGLDGKTGTLDCVAYGGDLPIYRHGFLSTSSDGRHLQYRDGTPFFYLADTHWFMEAEDFETQFLPTLRRREEEGYTAFQSHPVADTLCNDQGATSIDPTKYQALDRFFAAIADGGLVHAFGLGAHSNISYFTAAGGARLARYLNARYGAYPVIFFTSQEVDAPNSDPDQWKQVFDAWNQVDAYDQPATCHMWGSTHGEPMIWATDPGHDLFFLQAGHGTLQPQSHYQVYWNAAPTKPFIEAEANYEEIVLGADPNHADRVREAAYKALQCGGTGFGYGANGLWNDCTSDTDCSCCEQWGVHPWYDAIHFAGGKQMRHLRAFYDALPWWRLTPRFSDPTWAQFADSEASVLSSDGSDLYVAYFYGATAQGAIYRMNGTYSAYWFNPRTGHWSLIDDQVSPQSGHWNVPEKPDAQDWLLLLVSWGSLNTVHRRLDVSSSSGGAIYPNGLMLVARSKDRLFRLVPDAGFMVQSIILDGQTIAAATQFVLPADANDHTIQAVFSGAPISELVGEWHLDGVVEDLALDTVLDHDGQYEGAAFVQTDAVSSRSTLFGTPFGRVRIPDTDALDGMAALTVSLWAKLDQLPSGPVQPLGKDSAYRWILDTGGSAHFALATTNVAWYAAGTVASIGSMRLATGRWYHLAATYDGTLVRVYVDGQSAGTGSQAISGPIVSNGNDLIVGSSEAVNVGPFPGSVDEIRIYSRALSAAEIAALYQSY